MFGFSRRESPAVQLYGKLPIAKDYLRIGLGDGAGLDLRGWLDAAFSVSGAAEHAPRLAWPSRFVLGDVSKSSSQGVLWPSTDAGGLRPFPFLMAVVRQSRALLADMDRELRAARAVWDQLLVLHERLVESDDGVSGLQGIRGREIAVEEGYEPAVGSVPVDTWSRVVWPGVGVDGFMETLRSLESIRSRPGRGPLRLPLAERVGFCEQVVGWLGVLSELGFFGTRQLPTFFLPHAKMSAERDGAPFLTVFRAPLRPGDARWLAALDDHGPLGDGDLVTRVGQTSGDSERPEPHRVASEPSLADGMRGLVAGLGADGGPPTRG